MMFRLLYPQDPESVITKFNWQHLMGRNLTKAKLVGLGSFALRCPKHPNIKNPVDLIQTHWKCTRNCCIMGPDKGLLKKRKDLNERVTVLTGRRFQRCQYLESIFKFVTVNPFGFLLEKLMQQ